MAIKHLFLVDGSSFLFRAFYALPPLSRSDGTPVNAVFGFTTMLMKVVEDAHRESGDGVAVAVIFDAARKTFRNELYPQYKANRDEPPDELIPQFPLVREATRAFSLPCIESAGYEADDIIATYARQAARQGITVTIISSDKDLMQLVGGTVSMWDPMKNRKIGRDEVKEKFGVYPERVVDVQALAGDSTDNIPGVPGIGVKTAAELINEYGDLDTLLARAENIKQPKRREKLLDNADLARLSRQLVRLKDDVPLDQPLESLFFREPSRDTVLAFLRAQEFRRLIERIEGGEMLPGEGRARATPAAPRHATGTPAPAPSASRPVRARKEKIAVDYHLVTDEKTLAQWIARAREVGVVAFDTETTSLDSTRAELVGFSLCAESGQAAYVPLAHETPGSSVAQGEMDLGEADGKKPRAAKAALLPGQIPLARALALLQPLLEDEGVLKVGHNIKYDTNVMARYGITLSPVDDTMLLSYVLEGASHGHSLDELSALLLGHQTTTYEEVAGSGKAQIPFAQVPLERARDYAAEDADMTWRLHGLLKPHLLAEHMVTLYETMERPLIPVIARMERHGIRVDEKELIRLSGEFSSRLEILERDIHKLAGREFALASPKQLGEMLFDELGLPAPVRTGKSKQYSTTAGVLEDLAAEGHAIAQKVLDWRQLAKLKSTYTDALIAQINPETGRVHTSFSMAATSTGRLASSDPNLQNIPVRSEEGRKIRAAFIAEKGNVLVSLDYSQIELRLLAHVAGIEALKKAFRQGADIHALTASEMFGVPLEKMDGETRRRAKAINFGIIYGISPFGLARQLSIPQAEAKSYIETYFRRYPGIRDYMEDTRERARAAGFVATLFGRKCFVPGINDKNGARRGFAERAAINAPLQGTAADIIKRAMIRADARLAEAFPRVRLLLQVHDELLFECPESQAPKLIAAMKKVMEEAALPAVALSVPLVVDAAAGLSWSQAH